MLRIGRRDALALAGGTALAGVLAPSAALAKHHVAPLNFTNPADRFKAYMLMRGALDDRLVIGCVKGVYSGVVDAEMTPLYGVVSATFSRFRALAGGGYACVSAEQAYFTDLASGAWITSFANPYTGETVTVPVGGYPPAKTLFSPALEMTLARPIPGVAFDHVVQPVEVRGDDVWFTETTRTSGTPPGATKPFRYGETIILHARRSDLETPGIARVTCETTFNGVVSWRPWLNMGDRPGQLMAVGAGRYGATLDTLPQGWIDAAQQHRPELLANPQSVLDPLWNAVD